MLWTQPFPSSGSAILSALCSVLFSHRGESDCLRIVKSYHDIFPVVFQIAASQAGGSCMPVPCLLTM